jgi:hypothetical protein
LILWVAFTVEIHQAGATESSIRGVFSIWDDNVIIQQLGAPDEYLWSVRD